uniref:Alpha/beta hydrolase family protein n=1 Tax=Toxoplasma gondii COUG TaxID=1074873 RepID=A0A2G8XPE4_TOXGO|nr:alpha/beta hydrolase family protein [Toxoplasma gondii COUG]
MCRPAYRPRQLDDEALSLGLQYRQVLGIPIRVVEVDGSLPVTCLGFSEQTPRSVCCETPTPTPCSLCESPCHSRPPAKDATSVPHHRMIDGAEVTLPHHEGLRTTVFFIHGLGGRAGQFRHQIHFLAQRGCRCIAVDLPGHGESRLVPYDSSMFTLDKSRKIVKTIFDEMSNTRTCKRVNGTDGGEKELGVRGSRLRRHAVVVGHSLGSLFALTLFADLEKEGRNAEVSGIVLIGALGAYPHTGVQRLLLSCIPAFVLELVRGLIKRQVQRQLYHPVTLQHNTRLVFAEDSVTRQNPMHVILSTLLDLQTSRPKKFLEEGIGAYHEVPQRPSILLLTGEKDAVCPMRDNAVLLKRELLGLSRASVKQRCHGAEERHGAKKQAPTDNKSRPHTWEDLRELSETKVANGTEKPKQEVTHEHRLGPNDVPNRGATRKSHTVESENDARPDVEVDVIPCTGHNCMLEDPYTTNRMLWDFIKKVTRNSCGTSNVNNS